MTKDEEKDLYRLFDTICEKHTSSFVLDDDCGVPMCVISVDNDPPITQITHSSVVPNLRTDRITLAQKAVDSLAPFSAHGFYQIKKVNDTVVCTYTQRLVDQQTSIKTSIYRKALCEGLMCLRSALYEIHSALCAQEKRKEETCHE